MTGGKRWVVVGAYATAMAWVESSVVYYLRTMVNRIEPYQPNPLPMIGELGKAELIREAATLVMLLTVGILAGRTWRARLGYAAVAFGVWDIFYYVFLRALCRWPHSVFDWDLLFLLPLPWWGPVLAPVCIALLLIAWGTLASQFERTANSLKVRWTMWSLNLVGVLIALYVFMADSLPVANQGTEVLRNILPTHFNWPLFSLALLLMTAPVIENIVWLCRTRVAPVSPNATSTMEVQHEKLAQLF